MDDHTLQQVIDLAVKTAVLKAKKEAILECRPIGSYFMTETDDDPNVIFGGGWQKLTGRYVLQCSDANHKAGTTVEAGLPNIESHDGPYVYQYTPAGQGANFNSGCIIWNNNGGGVNSGPFPSTGSGNFYIDASKSNRIYGNSDTVQPPARIVNVWKRIS